jgi:hypothetical protein
MTPSMAQGRAADERLTANSPPASHVKRAGPSQPTPLSDATQHPSKGCGHVVV